jgi:hypothetical protein
MYYYTYRVDFNNGDYYLGQHKTSNLDDGYTGSGKKLNERTDPFEFVILDYYNSQKELNEAEKTLIGDLWWTDPKCLNLKEGGNGGWDAVNKSLDRSYMLSEEYREQKRQIALRLHREGKIKSFPNHASEKGVQAVKKMYPNGVWYGRTHTEETKQKMRKSKNVGQSNSQYGTMWITNGTTNSKISKDDDIPKGYRKGRVLKTED